ncbi:MAG: Bax inhibitor-1 family protein, partial [Chitinophagaceae bacterium]
MLFIIQIGLVVTISSAVQKINATVATVLFLIYAAINGVTLSGIFLAYTHSSLTGAFVVTAGMFGAMSVAGFVMKTDLTRFRSFFLMA